jgi:predicted ABC-type ATPase
VKTYFLVAGPNGAGKSTYGLQIIKKYFLENAEDIIYFYGDKERAHLFKLNPQLAKYKGDLDTEIANKFDSVIDYAISNSQNFAHEVNLSSPNVIYDLVYKNKLERIGYKTVLLFFDTLTQEGSENRVKLRVLEKGHNISPQTLKDNFIRSAQNFEKAFDKFDESYIFINEWGNNDNYPFILFSNKDNTPYVNQNKITSEIKNRFPNIFM